MMIGDYCFSSFCWTSFWNMATFFFHIASCNVTYTGWWFEPLWKIWKSIGMIIPNIWENKKCSKPPTSISMEMIMFEWYQNWGPQQNLVTGHLVPHWSISRSHVMLKKKPPRWLVHASLGWLNPIFAICVCLDQHYIYIYIHMYTWIV